MTAMPQPIVFGPLQLQPEIVEGYLRSLGAVTCHGTPLRHPGNRFLPWFDSYTGEVFRRFRFLRQEQRGAQVVLHTLAESDPDALFQERRDSSGDPCLRPASWDAAPLTAPFAIVLEPARAEVDGLPFAGFRYWFEYRHDRLPIHRLVDRQTWELGGNLDDVTVVCRNLFDLPCQRVTKAGGYSTVGLNQYVGVLPGNLWGRWSLLPAFDLQVGAGGILAGWFDQVSCIRSVIESQPGEDWVRYVDLHYFPSATTVATNPKTILHCPEVLDAVGTLNLWTRLHDQEHAKAARQFSLPPEAPPALVESLNVWHDFHFDTTYEQAVASAAELGADYVFIDPVWQNMETYARTLRETVGADALAQGVLGKLAGANMCCTLDFSVSPAAGGEEALRRLCERAAAKGVGILSWIACHYLPHTAMAERPELGHGAGGLFATKESGRHPDTGYAGHCWTVNLNAPIYDHLRDQFVGVAQRTGLAGYLWDSFSNLGWWQVDYSDGTCRPQYDRMARLYAELAQAGLYLMPEAIVSFSHHSCCGLHGGNVYAGELLGYSYRSNIGLPHQPGAPNLYAQVLRGETPVDELFRYFAHQRIPTMALAGIPAAERHPQGVAALQQLFRQYRQARPLMQRRTVLRGNVGVLWENDADTPLLWSFQRQPARQPCTDLLTGAEVTSGELLPNRVYLFDDETTLPGALA
jgi:hypothetical protein